MDKILFVNPPILFNSNKSRIEGPAPIRSNVSVPALLILGEFKKSGYQTHFIDMAAEGYNTVLQIRKNVYRFGLKNEELIAKITRTKPMAILLESMFVVNLEIFEEIAGAIKRNFPKIPIIAGGSFASEKPEWHLENNNVDFVVIGQGGKNIISLLNAIKMHENDFEKVGGIAFKMNDELKITGAIGKPKRFKPKFDYETVLFKENGEYRYPDTITKRNKIYSNDSAKEQRACVFYGSRGCPIGCDYCSAWAREGEIVQHMGGKKLFEQIKLLHEKYGVDVFYNQAETFGLHQEDKIFLKLLGEYRKMHPQITLNNPNAFFVKIFLKNKKIDKEFISLLKQAGFNIITLAIETFNQRFSKKINFFEIKFEDIKEMCKYIKKIGMKVDVNMLYGFPDETIEELENDLQKATELKKIVDLVSWGNLIIFPGSAYYKKAIKEKWFTEEHYKARIKGGYSFSKVNDFFNFTQIPTKRLQEVFEEKLGGS